MAHRGILKVGSVCLYDRWRNRQMMECLLSIFFQIRANWALHLLTAPDSFGSIAYEYEKNSYPRALADVLANNEQADDAIAFLQQADPEAIETLEIDLYSGFVLKSQMRKYFAFGEYLEADYRDRMYRAMAALTVTDPLDQTAEFPRKFWSASQDDCTTRVDCRNTDNLRAMRETSVYLMAEETGNEATRQRYKARLERYTSTLLDIGMGEWDSPIYHGHTTAAYLNLYDFATDPAVQEMAETALDWLFFTAALKYWRGTWTAPGKRVDGDDAANFFWLYFGKGASPERLENNWIYALTSDYQPPHEVMRLAQRALSLPVEVRRTHPHYENWKPGLYGPAFYETLYLANTYQLGSLARGTAGDWQGFGLAIATPNGPDELQIAATAPHTIAQYENLLIWHGSERPTLSLPKGAVHDDGAVTFVAIAETWLALHPFEQGFALEVGERHTHGSFETFRRQVLERSQLTYTADRVTYQGSQGKTVAVANQPDALPLVWRDHTLHDWAYHTDTTALEERLAASIETRF